MTRNTLIFAVFFAFGAVSGCSCEPEQNYCIELTELQTDTVSPAGVRTVFQATDCSGEPIPDLTDENIKILLDDQEMNSEGDVAPILTQQVDFDLYTLILLDMSDSIVDSGNLGSMISAARSLVHTLHSQGHHVAIYRFAGPTYFASVQDFTRDEDDLDAALDELAASDGLGTTDLYGSISKAIDVLDDTMIGKDLGSSTLVLFTDGTDEAMASSPSEAQAAVDNSESNVFTVGLGGDVNKEELISFGKSGFEWAEDSSKLSEAFSKVTDQIKNIANSYYLVAICSPRVGGWRDMTIKVKRNEELGRLTVGYNSNGFDIVGCDPQYVAFPCQDFECGEVEGISCGTCEGTTFCNLENKCEEACGDDIECGYNEGFDCGDCSEAGDGFTCDEHVCVDACADAECGYVLGVDCGDCSENGDTWTCDEHACVDACADAECGTVLGIDCGDCGSLYGEDWGCDTDHTCVEACADMECGTNMGIDCGDCSSYGAGYGCDDGTCVDACADAECGTVLGIDCGSCSTGYECNAMNQCSPEALTGMQWILVSGGGFTLGCDSTLDPDCDYNEQRHDLNLSDYYIMDVEATVEMYNSCVSDGGCNVSNVATGPQCNYGVSGREDHPINCINHTGMQEFCQWMGGDLPSEAQWERAYRGNHDGIIDTYWTYPWGDTPEPSCTEVVMSDGGAGCGLSHTDEVGTKPSTTFDLLNMGGNVSEWCVDWFSDALGGCGIGECDDPVGPDTGTERVVRGGNWNDMFSSAFRTAARDSEAPSTASAAVGGRCVLPL